MKRSDFLKKIGIGIGVAMVAPIALIQDPVPTKDPVQRVIEEMEGEIVEVALFYNGVELPSLQYQRQYIPYKLVLEKNHLRFGMPNICFKIKGTARMNEIRFFNVSRREDWGLIRLGSDNWVTDGSFIINFNG